MVNYEKVLKEYIKKFGEEPETMYMQVTTERQKVLILKECIKKNESLSDFYANKYILS
ncbi:hypothetical protein MUA90_12455 [Staphylococcus sp. IVB6181]|uniref:hypothetical protein n=1 Tax=unclassified Staphylococcus TaxID=91994 RepID=UPI0013C4174F|nr:MULTISPECIES: hypothetical protein [unclassified Staphylococcus]UXV34804.1 hypothetical protein MUA90_12455 [Staphylococcus sp. IVB6181]